MQFICQTALQLVIVAETSLTVPHISDVDSYAIIGDLLDFIFNT
jgi:hypothetical protein